MEAGSLVLTMAIHGVLCARRYNAVLSNKLLGSRKAERHDISGKLNFD